jgi:hypothetical protein
MSHGALIGLGVVAGVSARSYTALDALPVLAVVALGFSTGYFLLLWSTRAGGWYGAA